MLCSRISVSSSPDTQPSTRKTSSHSCRRWCTSKTIGARVHGGPRNLSDGVERFDRRQPHITQQHRIGHEGAVALVPLHHRRLEVLVVAPGHHPRRAGGDELAGIECDDVVQIRGAGQPLVEGALVAGKNSPTLVSCIVSRLSVILTGVVKMARCATRTASGSLVRRPEWEA